MTDGQRNYGAYRDVKGRIAPLRDDERIVGQIERHEVDATPDAARRIARRITAQGGFWGPRGETS